METTSRSPTDDQAAPDDLRRERELHAEVLGHEAELRRALRRLGQQARQRLDLGQIVSHNAAAFLGGAFVLGLWIGSRR